MTLARIFRLFSLSVSAIGLCALSVHAQTAVQFGINRGTSPNQIGVYDSQNVFQPFMTMPATGGGPLTTLPSTTSKSGFSIAPGVAPTSPNNGDVWTTSAGMYVQINGITVGPLSETGSGSFAATFPLVVSFSEGVATYSLNYDSTFTVSNNKLALSPIASGALLGNSSGSAAEPSAVQTGSGVLTALGSPLNGSGGVLSTSLASADLFIGNSSGIAAGVPMSGDATISNTGVLTLGTSGVTAGTYGDGTHSTQVTFDAKGRATAAQSVTITHASGDLPLGGGTMSGDIAMGSHNISGGGTATFTTFVGSLTGHSSLDLPLTGGTLTGPLYDNIGSFTPTPNFPAQQGFGVNESVAGTCATAQENCAYNFLNISSDNLVVGPSTSPLAIGIGFEVAHSFGGSSVTGNRLAAAFSLTQTAATGNTGANQSYGALGVFATANANDNGSSGSPAGQLEAQNIVATLGSSATFFKGFQGLEIDMHALTGASTSRKAILQLTELSDDAVQGSSGDAALVISNQSGAVGLNNGIVFGGFSGAWPLVSTGTAITCPSPCGTMASFIDMSGATITGFDWKFANASLTGAGAEAVTLLTSAASTSQIILNKTGGSGASNLLTGESAGSIRWRIIPGNSAAETGSNAGSDFSIDGYSDGGSHLGSWLQIARSNGAVTIPNLTTAGLVTTTSGGLLGSDGGGVACTGSPTSSFSTDSHGIVTHC